MEEGKCLGNISHASYGIVCCEGVFRDGTQRNIQVVAASGPFKNEISIYPAHVLNKASRSTVLLDEEISLLVQSVQAITGMLGVSTLDSVTLVRDLGLGVWSRLYHIARDMKSSDPKSIVDAWHKYESIRGHGWPDETSYTSAKFHNPMKRSVHPDTPEFWTCASCKMDKNPAHKSACVVCKVKAPRWTCEACSTSNKVLFSASFSLSPVAIVKFSEFNNLYVLSFISLFFIPPKIGDLTCISCFTYKEESAILRADKEVRESERLALREMELATKKERDAEIEEKRLVAVKKMLEDREQEFIAKGAEPLPEGKFRHPGSWDTCGGNPGMCLCTLHIFSMTRYQHI